jgi:hypothetical protein
MQTVNFILHDVFPTKQMIRIMPQSLGDTDDAPGKTQTGNACHTVEKQSTCLFPNRESSDGGPASGGNPKFIKSLILLVSNA